MLGDHVGGVPGESFASCPPGQIAGVFAGRAGSVPQGVGTAGQEASGRVSFLREPPWTESYCAMLRRPPRAPSSCAVWSPLALPATQGRGPDPSWKASKPLGLLLGLVSVSTKTQAVRWVKLQKFCTWQREQTELVHNSE